MSSDGRSCDSYKRIQLSGMGNAGEDCREVIRRRCCNSKVRNCYILSYRRCRKRNCSIKEVTPEITSKAGQKCTAIRRIIITENLVEAVSNAVKERLKSNVIGDPNVEGVRMGPLASKSQVNDVRANTKKLMDVCEVVYGDLDKVET